MDKIIKDITNNTVYLDIPDEVNIEYAQYPEPITLMKQKINKTQTNYITYIIEFLMTDYNTFKNTIIKYMESLSIEDLKLLNKTLKLSSYKLILTELNDILTKREWTINTVIMNVCISRSFNINIVKIWKQREYVFYTQYGNNTSYVVFNDSECVGTQIKPQWIEFPYNINKMNISQLKELQTQLNIKEKLKKQDLIDTINRLIY